MSINEIYDHELKFNVSNECIVTCFSDIQKSVSPGVSEDYMIVNGGQRRRDRE